MVCGLILEGKVMKINKDKLQIVIIITMMMLCLTGCCLSHEWMDADCVSPKICTKCGKSEGEALGHKWENATCTEAKTCSVCGTMEGEALGHSWKEATCTEAKTCGVCGTTEGEPLEHMVDEKGICNRCGKQNAIIITPENFDDYFEVVISEEMHSVKDSVSPVEDVYDFVIFEIISKCKMDIYSLEIEGMLIATCLEEEYANSEYLNISLKASPTASGYAHNVGRSVASNQWEVLFGRFALSHALRLYFTPFSEKCVYMYYQRI